jgi:hypothetical protein
MARSSYIYILHHSKGDRVMGTFTVKHEMVSYAHRFPAGALYCLRHRDGHPMVGATRVDIPLKEGE